MPRAVRTNSGSLNVLRRRDERAAHRRLRQSHAPRRERDAAVLHDGVEHHQQIQVEGREADALIHSVNHNHIPAWSGQVPSGCLHWARSLRNRMGVIRADRGLRQEQPLQGLGRADAHRAGRAGARRRAPRDAIDGHAGEQGNPRASRDAERGDRGRAARRSHDRRRSRHARSPRRGERRMRAPARRRAQPRPAQGRPRGAAALARDGARRVPKRPRWRRSRCPVPTRRPRR